MKTLQLSFLLAFTILFAQHSQAQYQSIFGQNSTEWVFEWGNLFGFAQDTIYVEKDTIVGGVDYKKLNIRIMKSQYFGAIIREDTTTGKVWYKRIYSALDPWADTTEQLIFDYSLSQGDTFNINCVWGQIPDSLSIVDTIYYKNNKKYIEFKMVHFNTGEPYTFIEGISCIFGIAYKHTSTGLMSHYLLCSYKDGVQVYANEPYNGDCNLWSPVSAIGNIEDLAFKIYPNPVINQLYIENPININITQIQVYNNLGQKVMEIPYTTSLDISDLSKGLYHLILLDTQSIISTQLIAKN